MFNDEIMSLPLGPGGLRSTDILGALDIDRGEAMDMVHCLPRGDIAATTRFYALVLAKRLQMPSVLDGPKDFGSVSEAARERVSKIGERFHMEYDRLTRGGDFFEGVGYDEFYDSPEATIVVALYDPPIQKGRGHMQCYTGGFVTLIPCDDPIM